jgi:hypothetical protein
VNRIPVEVVEATCERVAATPPEKARKLVTLMQREQPFLMGYLLATGEREFSRAEAELLHYWGIVIWQIMREGTPPPPKLTPKTFDKVERETFKMLKTLGRLKDRDLQKNVKLIFHNRNQVEILKVLLEEIMGEEDEGIREEYKGMIFLYLHVVVECFDQ